MCDDSTLELADITVLTDDSMLGLLHITVLTDDSTLDLDKITVLYGKSTLKSSRICLFYTDLIGFWYEKYAISVVGDSEIDQFIARSGFRGCRIYEKLSEDCFNYIPYYEMLHIKAFVYNLLDQNLSIKGILLLQRHKKQSIFM